MFWVSLNFHIIYRDKLKKPVLHFVLKQQKNLFLPTGSSNDRDGQTEKSTLPEPWRASKEVSEKQVLSELVNRWKGSLTHTD